MSNYITHARFITCTPLTEFQVTHKMELEFSIPANSQYLTDRIEIYRYIGNYMECVDLTSITETNSRLLYKATQSINDSEYGDTIKVQTYFPFTSDSSTIQSNVSAISSFTDDFSGILSNSFDLRSFHGLSIQAPGFANNFSVVSDIGFTRRVIYYIIKTYVRGRPDSAPYLLTPDYESKIFSNHSTKTQVRHDYLHYEGDEIWASNLNGLAGFTDQYGGVSRTAVDTNRLYLDATQSGPTGRGGYAWLSDRDTGKVFRHDLRDGALSQVFNTNVQGRGHGIGIDISTGDCISVPGSQQPGRVTQGPHIFRCNISNGSVQRIQSNIGGWFGYGVIPIFGKPDRMFISDNYNEPRIAFINKNPARVITGSDNAYGYAACSSPNGFGLQSVIYAPVYQPATTKQVAVINTDDASHFKKTLDVQAQDGTWLKHTSPRITTDSHAIFPNTILNPSGERNYFSIMTNKEFGVYIPPDANSSEDVVINWAIHYSEGSQVPGYDGENNLWYLDGNNKIKYYRSNSVDRFPYGGNTRYETAPLQYWPTSQTNTTEIEWFLTRNQTVYTLREDTGTREIIDQGTLDNSVNNVTWDPHRPAEYNSYTLYQTTSTASASAVWDSMVERKMWRVIDRPNTTFFKVYTGKSKVDSRGKKWGIRMNVRDIYDVYGSGYNDLDDFYENGRLIWEPEIKRRIKAWYDEFANDVKSYLNISNRLDLINNNQKGTLVHPFFQFATSLTNNNKSLYYINSNLDTDKKTEIEAYINSIKRYNFRNKTCNKLYMYSDFTGNILAGTIDAVTSNKDTIYPATTDPQINVSVSGRQSSPYNEKYPKCYPWKNTIPASMSALFDAISGYDDFSVNYNISTYMGSYLITAFSILTNDFKSPYFTDIDNLEQLTDIQNTSYNIDKNYISDTNITYTYHSPTMIGLYYLPSGNPNSFEYIKPVPDKNTGYFTPSGVIQVTNIYNETGVCSTKTLANTARVAVFERWPEPRFCIDSFDIPTLRHDQFCRNSWGYPDRFTWSDLMYKESQKREALRFDITYGVDPLSANILNRTIARTWPISSYTIKISTDNSRLGWINNEQSINNIFTPQDSQNNFKTLSGMKFRYGNYQLTMNAFASTTNTSADMEFIQYVKISEFKPFANFWAISAETVDSSYRYDGTPITTIDVTSVPNGVYIDSSDIQYHFVSGYAPNLTVWFQDSSEAHTFPISSYHWNFGDPYNEGPSDIYSISSNYFTISTTSHTGNFNDGYWTTNTQSHTAKHTYIMPGTYDVTLTVKASETGSSDICARYTDVIDTKKFYIYVEEILPECGTILASLTATSGFVDSTIGVSGDTPLTVYFNASDIIAGSFPICRIDWDFGDGTVQRVTRRPLMTATYDNTPFVNISAYLYDLDDPRNIVVPHTYINNTAAPQTFDIHISAYACNTNTMIHCSAAALVKSVGSIIDIPPEETKRLINSRVDEAGNLVYLVEGQSEFITHTAVLTGEIK